MQLWIASYAKCFRMRVSCFRVVVRGEVSKFIPHCPNCSKKAILCFALFLFSSKMNQAQSETERVRSSNVQFLALVIRCFTQCFSSINDNRN